MRSFKCRELQTHGREREPRTVGSVVGRYVGT